MMTEEQIKEQIKKQVTDPEIGINVVDLGLIYDIKIKEDKVIIKMTLTSPGCPYGEKIVRDVKSLVESSVDLLVEVELVWDPPWSKDKMSQVARDHLMFFGTS